MGVPKAGWFISWKIASRNMDDDLGVPPLFQKKPPYGKSPWINKPITQNHPDNGGSSPATLSAFSRSMWPVSM